MTYLRQPKITVLTVGDELLTGETTDTNFPAIATSMLETGFTVIRHVTVADDVGKIAESIDLLSGESDAIIITGGLGPTQDDLTREGISQATGLKLEFREEIADYNRRYFQALDREMPEENLRQAYMPENALEIPPQGGTAPGFVVRSSGALIFALPGVPREMNAMLEKYVVPRLVESFGGGEVTVLRKINTFGAGESDIAKLVSPLVGTGGVRYGFLVSLGMVVIKLVATGKTRDEASAKLDEEQSRVVSSLGALVFGIDDERMEEVTGRLLRERGLTLATAESCTAGMVSSRITGVPGSSDYFLGGIVTYSIEAKKKLLAVSRDTLSHGAVSEEVAAAMAESVKRMFSSDIGLSITGIAGPGSGGGEKPVGTVCLGLAHSSGLKTWQRRLPGDRPMIRNIATLGALNAVRLHLSSADSARTD